MQLFKTVSSSIYYPGFYSHIRKGRIEDVVKTFLIMGVVGIGFSLLGVFALVVPFAFSNPTAKLEQAFLDNLVVSFASSTLSINQPQPLYINNPFTDDPKYLAVFDTENTLDEDPKDISTLAILKKEYVMLRSADERSERESYDDLGATTTLTIQKSDISAFTQALRPYVAPMILIGAICVVVLGSVFGAIAWVFFHALYLLIPALLLYVFGKIRDEKGSYKEMYLVAAYASIPVAIISFAMLLLSIPRIDFAYTLLLIVVALVNLHGAKKHTA